MSADLPPYQFDVRIAYADTDRMGVMYYGNYFVLFERGRTEMLRSLGLRYRDMEEQHKVYLPVSEANCRYFAPVKYDDMVRIVTRVTAVGAAHLDFSYEVFDAETGRRLAEGFTRHPFINDSWKPVRVPAFFRALLDRAPR